MTPLIAVAGIPAALIGLGWLGLKIKSAPFPPYAIAAHSAGNTSYP